MKKRLIHAVVCSLCTCFLTGHAQETTETEKKEVYELNPFNVDESGNVGYSATNTLSGTRFNSSLRDTSASVSVWTQEFIEDTGLNEIDELIDYSLNTVLDTADQEGAGGNFNTFTGAQYVTQRIRTRGIDASRGLDYFKSITPDDSYRVGRYDDSRGPNGVLFGVSQVGGLINQTSLVANTYQDSGRVRYSFGSNSRDRAEFRYNKVIVEDKLALVVAGLNQDNSTWRDWAQEDKERIYGALTWRINDKITFRANYEDGWDYRTTQQPGTVVDKVLPWYDNMQALGMEAVLFTPNGGNPNNNRNRVFGVTGRDGNPNNATRLTYIENDGTLYNAVGTYTTGGYDDERVRHPDGTAGLGDRNHRINDPAFLPYERAPAGPDIFRTTDLSNYAGFLDIQITDNWFFNIQYGHQRSIIDTPQIQGSRPEFQADPNLTQGVDGPPNPYAGRFFFDGDYRRDKNHSLYEELRASTSYNLNLADNNDNWLSWLGNHRIAIAASEVDEESRRGNTWLSLGGNPTNSGNYVDFYGNRYPNSNYLQTNNRITIRNYFDFEDYSTWKAGSWRSLPETITTDVYEGVPTEYPVVWAESQPGNINYKVNQVTDSYMGVMQSYFWDSRFVVTFGYRKDEVQIDRAGHFRDPIIGWIPDLSITSDTPSDDNTIPAPPSTDFEGTVRTLGGVLHITENFSLVANTATNIGIPDFRRTVFPEGATSPPPNGDGSDFGIDFSLFNNRLAGRLVYYETEAIQEVVGGSQASNPMEAIYEIYEEFLTGPPLDDLLNRRSELRPEVNGRFRDNVSSGYELRLTANITDNWRLTLNAAKTDRIVSNMYSKAIDFLGLMKGEDGLVVQGVSETEFPDPENEGDTLVGYVVTDTGAYESGKVISELLAYESDLPEGQNVSNTPDIGGSIAQELFELVDDVNDEIQIQEKRWGLRPYRFNVFTAYDFTEGRLKGWTIGGGYRWNDANIIGEENGIEFEGEPQTNADLFIRYRTARNSSFLGDGRWTFQLNVSNLFDENTIIPSRLAIDGNLEYMVPGGRGVAYARFDIPDPRAYRFTVTYDF